MAWISLRGSWRVTDRLVASFLRGELKPSLMSAMVCSVARGLVLGFKTTTWLSTFGGGVNRLRLMMGPRVTCA